MTKGTPSLGKHNKVVHIRCRRCESILSTRSRRDAATADIPIPRLGISDGSGEPAHEGKEEVARFCESNIKSWN
jgi:hypothetical protein